MQYHMCSITYSYIPFQRDERETFFPHRIYMSSFIITSNVEGVLINITTFSPVGLSG